SDGGAEFFQINHEWGLTQWRSQSLGARTLPFDRRTFFRLMASEDYHFDDLTVGPYTSLRRAGASAPPQVPPAPRPPNPPPRTARRPRRPGPVRRRGRRGPVARSATAAVAVETLPPGSLTSPCRSTSSSTAPPTRPRGTARSRPCGSSSKTTWRNWTRSRS